MFGTCWAVALINGSTVDLMALLDEECDRPLDGSDVVKGLLKVLWLRYLLRDKDPLQRDDDEEEDEIDGQVDHFDSKLANENGTSITTNSGAVITRVDACKTRRVDPDGTVTVIDANLGIKIQTYPDGSTVTVHKDGTRISQKRDGTRIVVRPDGSRLQTNSDGTQIETKSNGERVQIRGEVTITVFTDGRKLQRNATTGVIVETFMMAPCPQKPDGQKLVVFRDGRKVQWNPNGTIEMLKGEENPNKS